MKAATDCPIAARAAHPLLVAASIDPRTLIRGLCGLFALSWNLNTSAESSLGLRFEADQDGLQVPKGFEVCVVAEGIGMARHLVVRENGDIYVAMRETHTGKSLAALRDTDGDGVADLIHYFGDYGECGGVELYGDYLYFSNMRKVFRLPLDPEALVPTGEAEVIAEGFAPNGPWHGYKIPVIDEAGNLYVNVGSPSNTCQQEWRTAGSPGIDPCPQIERHAGIWLFNAETPGQQQTVEGVRYAAGLRNSVAMAWNPFSKALYAIPHGRDMLHPLWEEYYTPEDNAELPAEEFFRLEADSDGGWPYTYYDHRVGARMVAPEYGGNGKMVDESGRFDDPIFAFPGHWAPNDLIFYTGTQFPEAYREGAFVAFVGGWGRAPLPQEGYNVVFIPFKDGLPSGDFTRFATGFPRKPYVNGPQEAAHRPTGLAEGPDGSIYVADSVKGRIWRIAYTGASREVPVAAAPLPSEEPEVATATASEFTAGKDAYQIYCASCHMADGGGVARFQPSLIHSPIVDGPTTDLVQVVLNGKATDAYANRMPPFAALDDATIAEILTYVRTRFGNQPSTVDADAVKAVRSSSN